MSGGRVALVGAGPGDPALLTVRALELLRSAEVVAYDELVSESILALIPPDAEMIAVGRRSGSGHTGYRLHPDVLTRARDGKRVVRLKAGDPLVFGRGAEEAEELAAAGVPFEIVPGITAALGAAAYGAIPLTHRDHAAQVLFATGHRKGGRVQPPEPAPGRTLALYMGARHLAENLAAMVAAGWAASTPAALVIAATTADERTIEGTLATLANRTGDATSALPALLLVGDVVATRAAIDWRARLPLRGRRVVVARARSGPSRVAAALRTAGAEVLELPNVESVVDADEAAWLAAITHLDRYGAVLVTSGEAAEALVRTAPLAPEASAFRSATPVIAVGASIAALLRARGFAVTMTLSGACADGLAPVALQLRGRRVLVPVTDRGRPALASELRRLGAEPDLVVVARERRAGVARLPSRVDLVVLPASSAAEALYTAAPAWLREAPAVAIGARTEEAARRLGVGRVVRAAEDSIDALVAAAITAGEGRAPATPAGRSDPPPPEARS